MRMIATQLIIIILVMLCSIQANFQTLPDDKFLSNPSDIDQCMNLNPWKYKIDLNEEPVIGIISQTIDFSPSSHNDTRFDNYTSFIMGGYVRFLQGAGARVVPLVYGEPEEVTIKKLKSLNGVLFPGGDGNYSTLGKFVLDYAIKENDEGRFFPIWGTCLGFEYFISMTANMGIHALQKLPVVHKCLPLTFVGEPQDSKIFCSFGEQAQEFTEAPLTWNYHDYSVPLTMFVLDKGLSSFWNITSISHTDQGDAFVATIEAKNYPFMATQFHPEKASQAWADNYGFNHSWQSIKLNNVFADQFVAMTRANSNSFGNYTETQKVLIDNYDKFETEYKAGEVYVFKDQKESYIY